MENFRVLKEKYLIYTPSRELLLLESNYGKRPEVFVPYLMREGIDVNDFTYLEPVLEELIQDEKKFPLITREVRHPRLDGSSGKLKKAEWLQIRAYFAYLADFTRREEDRIRAAASKEHLQMYYRSFDELKELASERRVRMDYTLLSAMDKLEEKVLVKEKE